MFSFITFYYSDLIRKDGSNFAFQRMAKKCNPCFYAMNDILNDHQMRWREKGNNPEETGRACCPETRSEENTGLDQKSEHNCVWKKNRHPSLPHGGTEGPLKMTTTWWSWVPARGSGSTYYELTYYQAWMTRKKGDLKDRVKSPTCGGGKQSATSRSILKTRTNKFTRELNTRTKTNNSIHEKTSRYPKELHVEIYFRDRVEKRRTRTCTHSKRVGRRKLSEKATHTRERRNF